MTKTIGDFEIEVWTGGSPVWVHIRHNSSEFQRQGIEFKFSAQHLPDLKYAVECAIREADAQRTNADETFPKEST